MDLRSRVREHLEDPLGTHHCPAGGGRGGGAHPPGVHPVLRQMITASIESFLAGGETEASCADTLSAMIDIIMNGIRRR